MCALIAKQRIQKRSPWKCPLVSDEATVAFDEVLLPFSPAVEPFVADMVEFETGEAEDADPADDICLHN
jgi:hypothetical protein